MLKVGAANARADSRAYDLDLDGADVRRAADGWHAVLHLGGANHRLWLPRLRKQPVVLELPLDCDFDLRTQAARRLWSALEQRALGPPSLNLSVQRRQRLTLALRALDAHREGNSYRTIAAVLFGKPRVSDHAWKTHDLRSRTIRLVQNGLVLARSGYRALLRNGRRQR